MYSTILKGHFVPSWLRSQRKELCSDNHHLYPQCCGQTLCGLFSTPSLTDHHNLSLRQCECVILDLHRCKSRQAWVLCLSSYETKIKLEAALSAYLGENPLLAHPGYCAHDWGLNTHFFTGRQLGVIFSFCSHLLFPARGLPLDSKSTTMSSIFSPSPSFSFQLPACRQRQSLLLTGSCGETRHTGVIQDDASVLIIPQL